MFDDFGINAGFVEDEYHRYLENPQLVHPSWREYFDRFTAKPNGNGASYANGNGASYANGNGASYANGVSTNGLGNGVVAKAVVPGARVSSDVFAQAKVTNLVNAYRTRGHLYADINPLTEPPTVRTDLELARFDLTEGELDKRFSTGGATSEPVLTLRQIILTLEETYCRSIGVEVTQIEEPEQRDFLIERMEATKNRLDLSQNEQLHILAKLTDAEALEQFIHKNFVGAKRFSLEGGEALIPLMDLLVESAGAQGVEEIVIGMAHRGRLNMLCNILDKNVRELFAAFDDKHPERYLGSGDVKYHLGYSTDKTTASGNQVHLTMAFNPSHLEFVNPVVEGRVRAKQDRRGDTQRKRVLPLLVHGDAAFMGQGCVAETLNLAGLEGYTTGGTIHVVINNQVGFTTEPSDSRSTRYATDIARMLKVPVFHVNGEDPEAVVQVTRLATEFRQRFGKDVIIDMLCYRRWGHNEGDEPRFTQPVMYATIDKQPSVREMYVRRMVETGKLTLEHAETIVKESRDRLTKAREETKTADFAREPHAGGGVWAGYVGGPDALTAEVETGYDKAKLLELLRGISNVPEGFKANPKVLETMRKRLEKAEKGEPLDWAAGELLAYATLVANGTSVRLSGQDCRRGTFSHRHAVLREIETGRSYTPLHAVQNGGRFEVWDSPLSETGVLGFDYGVSLDSPQNLTIWEAQFGDFANGAQVIIDQFIFAAEDKWHRLSGLVMLLPHGFEGQGPEHSSARLERFLQQSAEDNIQVCNLTTPAQIFHALRRQILRPWRKPLVIMSPKSLLRLPEATSTLDELANGKFQRAIPDLAGLDPKKVTKILLCSGKIFYALEAERKRLGREDVAIVRLEQLYPLNDEISAALAPYKDGTPLVWVQDEPLNMGAWFYLNARFAGFYGNRLPLSCVSRAESASPATGSLKAHKLEEQMILDAAFSR